MTYLELQIAVADAIIDPVPIVTAAIPRLINQAIKQLEGRFNFKAMQANQAYTTTANSRTLVGASGALPADFKAFRGLPFYIENLGSSRPMDLVASTESVLRRWNNDDIGDPHSLVVDDGLQVWPLPDGTSDYANGEYRITLPYWKTLANLAASGDTNWFTLNAEQYIINWTVREGFAIDWDEARMNVWKDRAEEEALRTILQGKKQWLTMNDTLVPHLGALEGPDSVR